MRGNIIGKILFAITGVIALVFGAVPALAGPGGGHGDHGGGGGHGSHGGGSGDGSCDTYTDDVGNTISTCAAAADSYVPDLDAASPSDIQRAKEIHQATLDWCGDHQSTASLRRDGFRPAHAGATHWVIPPRQRTREFGPGKPIMGMWVDGETVGAVYSDKTGFPALGSIPRPHSHHGSGGKEMLHVWCTEDLAEAFVTRGPHLPGGGLPDSGSTGTGSTADSGSADNNGSTSKSEGGHSGHSGESGHSGHQHGEAKAGAEGDTFSQPAATEHRREALAAVVVPLDRLVDCLEAQVAKIGG